MALRDENYLFTRRIADRGSDEIVFDSQDRKIQETDPKDVIWDEIVGKEEHPEDCGGYKFLETDSEAFIRDENCGKEEYPGNCSVIYPSPPCFDEYGDEEWYFWVTGRNRNLPDDESGFKSRKVGVTAVENGDATVALGEDAVGSGSVTVPKGGNVLDGCDAPILETPLKDPANTRDLNFSLINMACSTLLKIRINDINQDARFTDVPTAISDNIPNVRVRKKYYVFNYDAVGPKVNGDCMDLDIMHEMVITCGGPIQAVLFGKGEVKLEQLATIANVEVQNVDGKYEAKEIGFNNVPFDPGGGYGRSKGKTRGRVFRRRGE